MSSSFDLQLKPSRQLTMMNLADDILDTIPFLKTTMECKIKIECNPVIFEHFIPWACGQLTMSRTVKVKKVYRTEAVTPRPRSRLQPEDSKLGRKSTILSIPVPAHQQPLPKPASEENVFISDEPPIIIEAVYSHTEQVLQLKIEKMNNIPPMLFKLLALIAKFHPLLSSIIINSGLNASGLYELSHFSQIAALMEIDLNGCFIPELNYYILLQNSSNLKYLSLSRCKINDDALKEICDCLGFLDKASKTLTVLNLSCNSITDKGASYIAKVLRTNRRLTYLNLCSNRISDVGSNEIWTSLGEFPLTVEEMNDHLIRRTDYLKQKNTLIARFLKELRCDPSAHSILSRKKKIRSKVPMLRKLNTARAATQTTDTTYDNITTLYTRAKRLACAMVPTPPEPFPNKDLKIVNGQILFKGNHTLGSLSLAYNNLTDLALKKIVQVLQEQSKLKPGPQSGLARVVLKGNMVGGKELNVIDYLLGVKLNNIPKADVQSLLKKKLLLKMPTKTNKENKENKENK